MCSEKRTLVCPLVGLESRNDVSAFKMQKRVRRDNKLLVSKANLETCVEPIS